MEYDMMKGKPLTKSEIMCLLDLIESSKVLWRKSTSASNNKMKQEEWVRLTTRFNKTNTRRTPQQLRLKWENLKKSSRKRDIKIQMNEANGSTLYIPPDEVLDRVSTLLLGTDNKIVLNILDDKEPQFVYVESGDGDETGEGIDSENGDGNDYENDNGEIESDGGINHHSQKNIKDTETGKNEVKITVHRQRMKKVAKKSNDKSNNTVENAKKARNLALAEYFRLKKRCLNAKLTNILLQNENLRLQNKRLKLELGES